MDLILSNVGIVPFSLGHHRKWSSNYHNDGVGPFSDVQPRLPIRVDVVFGDEAVRGEAQEHARRPALAHLVSQHHHLKEVREEIKYHSELETTLLQNYLNLRLSWSF